MTKVQSAAIVARNVSSGKTLPAYLVFGEEIYWHDKLMDSLSKCFSGERENLQGDEISWQILSDLVSQPSFFGPKLWIVRGAQALFQARAGSEASGPAAGSLSVSGENCVVLSCVVKENPASKGFLARWSEAGYAIVEASQPSFTEAAEWVVDAMSERGFKMSRDAADNLVTIVGRSVERLEMEIEKINAYMGGAKSGSREVTSSIVALCASQDPEKTAFGLIDAIAARNPQRAFSEYMDVKTRGANEIAIIALLGSHFGLMWRAKQAKMKGANESSLAKILGVHPYAARKALQQAGKWTFAQMEEALRLLCKVDENLKRGRIDTDRAMDYLLSGLCRIR